VVFIQRAVRRWLKARHVVAAGRELARGLEKGAMSHDGDDSEGERRHEAETREAQAAADKEAYQR